MADIKQQRNYFDKVGRKGRMTNIPLGNTGFESSGNSGQLTKSGRIYKNDLLDADLTSQQATRRKLKGV